MVSKKRIIIVVVTYLIAIAIVSLTLGREILSGRTPGLVSFSIIHFLGYLFFLLMPVEALLPYYLAEGHSGILLVLVALSTAIIAQLIDYGIGYSFSRRIIYDVIGQKRYKRAEKTIHRYGSLAILLFNLFPLSSPVIVLVAGVFRFGVKRVLLYSFIGLLIKYIVIVSFFGFLR